MTTIYIGLLVTAILYTLLLAFFRHVWEPHLTWLEVVVGVALCLAAPYLAARYAGIVLDWQTYEQLVWTAFLVGGAPIVVWQISLSVRAWRRIESSIRSQHGHEANPAAKMALSRRRDPETDD